MRRVSGLWGSTDMPFATRQDFVAAMEAGGIAAMEVLARDLKALGLYASRALSYAGVEVEMLEHRLSAEQIRIYDSYAGAFEIIHNNLTAALEAANITGEGGKAYNRNAKSRRAFGLRIQQAALLQSSDHGDEGPEPHRVDRARFGSRPRRRDPDRLDRAKR